MSLTWVLLMFRSVRSVLQVRFFWAATPLDSASAHVLKAFHTRLVAQKVWDERTVPVMLKSHVFMDPWKSRRWSGPVSHPLTFPVLSWSPERSPWRPWASVCLSLSLSLCLAESRRPSSQRDRDRDLSQENGGSMTLGGTHHGGTGLTPPQVLPCFTRSSGHSWLLFASVLATGTS